MTDPSDDFAGNLADIPGSPADGRHTLAVIGAVDPALLDLVDLALAGQDAVVIRAGLHFAADGEAGSSDTDDDLVRLVSHSSAEGFDDEPVRLDVPMPSPAPPAPCARSWSPSLRTAPSKIRAAPPSSSCRRPSSSPISCPAWPRSSPAPA